MTQISARIHVLLASQSPVGLVIRRGPSKQVCTILWDRRRDDFRIGQWLKGRIYARRSDLSPDARYFLYFAMNGKWKSPSWGSWTAISRAPYLKAMAMFPKGDCWHGGGLFTSNTSYWLNDGYGHAMLRDTTEVTRDWNFEPPAYFGGECTGVYYARLLRDGWRYVEQINVAEGHEDDIFEKPLDNGWVVRKIAHAESGDHPVGKGCYWDEHELVHAATGQREACPHWEWAEVDGNRLVWAGDGKLYARPINEAGMANDFQLFDFNDMIFERIEAPY